MNENDDNIHLLIDKYEKMRYMGKNIYFDADEFAMLANYYNDFGDVAEAAYITESGLKMHPGSTHLMIIKAKLLVEKEKYEEALDYLSAIGDEKNNVDYLLVKIEALLFSHHAIEANELLEYVLSSKVLSGYDYYTFLVETAYLYSGLDEYGTSIVLLEKVFRIDNEDIEVLMELAFAYEMTDNFDKSIEFYNRILDIEPYSFDSWINLGKLHSMRQEYDKAIEAFDFALTINENEVSVMKMKALSHYLNNNIEEAVRIFRECLEGSPNDESLYDSLLEGYEVMEQYDEMLDVITKKEAKFGSERINLQRAHILLTQEKYEEAQEVFEKIPERDKNTFDYYILEGELALHNQDLVTAETAYMLAMIDSPDDEIVIDKLANISLEQGKLEKSAEFLDHLIRINPDFPTAKARLAFLRIEIGNKEPFDEIMSQFTDDELRGLLNLIYENDKDYSKFSREEVLIRLNEARENRVLFKNIKY